VILAYSLTDPPELVCVIRVPSEARYFETLGTYLPHQPHVLARISAPATWCAEFYRRYRADMVKPTWYRATPDVLTYLRGSADVKGPARDPRRRLGDAECLEIFRAAHAPDRVTDAAIGDRYGVSKITVGLIARGMSHKHLFHTRPADGEPVGSYFVSEVIGGPEYLLRFGVRTR
jgi:hypothetical protein